MRFGVFAIGLFAACGSTSSHRTLTTFRTACADNQFWRDGTCKPRIDVAPNLAASKDALEVPEIEVANAALDAVAKSEPLAHESNVAYWEQRGISYAFVDNNPKAREAFTRLLALAPGHFLSYNLSPRATTIFEAVRNETRQVAAPTVEVNWANGQRVGTPVAIDVSVIADPLDFIKKATLFVRTRGETQWRAADLALTGVGKEQQLVLPPIEATKPQSIELYLRAYDGAGNEVLSWADARRPREIPLRYDEPPPWYKKWWVLTLIGSGAVIGTAAIVYGVTREPPDRVNAYPDVH